MTNPARAIPLLTSAAALAAETDAWIVDIWGVMHNGVAAYPGAVDACTRFRAGGGSVVLLTNAPRPWSSVKTQLEALHIPEGSYDVILTSGDVTRDLIAANAKRPIFHLGPERDAPIFAGLDVKFTSAERAEVAVNTGLFDDASETPADYAGMLADFRARGVLMICANPDLKVEKGDTILYCAGALAEAYDALGGEVLLAGKPYPPIYEIAFERIAAVRGRPVPKDRILAIGDGVNTDIKGAATMGLRSLFVPSRVNMSSSNGVSPEELAAAFAGLPFAPDAAIIGLKW